MLSIRGWFERAGAIFIVVGLATALSIWYFTAVLPPVPKRPLRIGFEQNPPVQIRTEKGFAGLAVETVNEAAKRAGISLVWVETGTSSEEALQKGLVDLWPLMADLPERHKRLHITRPWLHSTHALLVRGNVGSIDHGFTGRIAHFKMPLHTRLLREQFPEAQLADYPAAQEAVKAVCNGAAEMAFLEGRSALTQLREKPRECNSASLRILNLPETTIQLGVASTFEAAGAAEQLRSEITNLFRDGVLAVMVAKYSYYGLDDTWATYELMETSERARWLSWGIASLAIALFFALWQAWSLRRARQVAELANAATSQALSRYELVARATNDALFECDLETGTVTWNEAVQVLFRYTADQVGSSIRWWEERVHPDDRQRVLTGIHSAIAQGAPTWSDEYRFRCGDGAYASVVDRGYLLYDNGKPTRLVRAIMDVTARHNLEEQLRQSQKMEAMGRLAGGIAHDFNNLLTVINGYSYLLRIDVGPASPFHQRLDEIHKAGQRAAELTQQLLAFSRKQLLQMKILNLNTVITDSARILGRLLGEDVELILDLDPSLGSVRADAGQIHQVLINLAVNARDAMPAGGKLVLASANVAVKESAKPESAGVPPGKYVLLTVTDAGSGLSSEARAHLFEPFFTTKAPGKGTGLGLSIVYGIVRQSGGFVSVFSARDKGTSVRIFLPVIEAAVSAATDPIHSGPVRGSETVLLVEDQEQVRELAAVILKELGYHVLEAANADDALLLGARHDGPIHVLLTDVLMPGMTGCALVDRLRPARPEMNVIYMSGYADRETVDEAIQSPDALFLQKPFTSETLAVKLREALQSTRTNLATHRAAAGPTPAF